ncbi:MAG: hypothetical protein WCL08_00045 [Verrucomicrobiota bacterium]
MIEAPERKPFTPKDQPPAASMEETLAYMDATSEIASRPTDKMRRRVINRILDITGRVKDQKHALARACHYMLEKGYLKKPCWMYRIQPWISIFSTEELMDAYAMLQEEFVEPF